MSRVAHAEVVFECAAEVEVEVFQGRRQYTIIDLTPYVTPYAGALLEGADDDIVGSP